MSVGQGLGRCGKESAIEDAMEYKGETRARRPGTALALALVAPGLAYLYVGRLARGLTINLLWVLTIEVFLILWMQRRFFPVGPALVFGLGGLMGALAVGWHVRGIIRAKGLEHEYVIRPFNHWLVYGLVAFGTFYLPAILSLRFLSQRMISVVQVQGSGMMPTLRDGDVILVDRIMDKEKFQIGAMVSFKLNDQSVRTMRLVAGPGDTVRVEGGLVMRNEVLLPRQVLLPSEVVQGGGDLGAFADEVSWMTETNDGVRYPLAVAKRVVDLTESESVTVPSGSFYLLLDNRKQVPLLPGEPTMRDSRDFGAVPGERILGMPSYVLWSSDPQGGVRLGRIGLAL